MPMPAVDRFSAMYASALPVVCGFISLRVGGNRQLAEDLTSEAFAAAVAEYRAGRPEVFTTSWLCTVAKRRLIDHWRRENVASKKVIPMSGHGLVFDSPEPGERDSVMQALGTLAPEQRTSPCEPEVPEFHRARRRTSVRSGRGATPCVHSGQALTGTVSSARSAKRRQHRCSS